MLEAEIAEVAHDVWESMFDLQLTVVDDLTVDGPSLTGIVHIDGGWRGAVTLHCSVALAAELTDRLFDDSGDNDVRDLLGELTNQLGGNIKAMLPSASSLSLPAVAVGSDYQVTVTDTRVAARVTLACNGSPVVISLLERTA